MTAASNSVNAREAQRDKEFSFDAAHFNRIRKLIYQHAGISLHQGKQAMVYSRVSRRVRELNHGSFSRYLHWLEHVTGAQAEQEWQEFVNCLTTNLTSFFREQHHFPLLAAELIKRRGQHTRIWCNAASTGEEPYSLAMVVRETLGANPDVTLICTDIDTKVLATAARGVYPAESRGLSPERLSRHFLRGTGGNAGVIRVKPDLQRLVEFRALNLIDARWDLGQPFDIVFCRNVMIYFDKETQRRVLAGLHRILSPHGMLFVGHSENYSAARDLFHLCGKTKYERV